MPTRREETDLATWNHQTTALAAVLRNHLATDGHCATCVTADGQPAPAPCATFTTTRALLRQTCSNG